MRFKLLAVAAMAGLMMSAPASAAPQCCDMPCCAGDKAPCCDMPCCAGADAMAKADSTEAVTIMLASFEREVQDPQLPDPQLQPAAPVRQAVEVWFHRPTRVGNVILQGRYVIEHDNDRMARGEPCTHIYAYKDQKTPVVAFHCTHLERDRASNNVAVYYTDADGLARLTEFQFAGEHAAHGVPATIR